MDNIIKILNNLVLNKNEEDTASYIYEFLIKSRKFSSVEKVAVDDRRYNIVATKGKPELMFFSHMDTVSRHEDQFYSIINDQYFGLGAKDMKGGIASLLAAIDELTELPQLGLVFYTGEETDQVGIKNIIDHWVYNPSLVICPESRFVILNGGRGLIVLKVKIIGKSIHSARANQGKSAITGLYDLVHWYDEKCRKFGNKSLGVPYSTILSMYSDPLDSLEGIVPDICYANIEIRTTHTKLNSEFFQVITDEFARHSGLKIEISIQDAYSSTFIEKEKLSKLESAIQTVANVEYGDLSLSGFNDVFLLTHKYNTPVVNFGPYGEGNHTSQEWVSLDSVMKTKEIYMNLIRQY